jgi:hypothetical protein
VQAQASVSTRVPRILRVAGLRCLRLLQSKQTVLCGGSFAASGSVANDARGNSMKNPLDSLWGTVISGLILTLILYFVVKSILA